MRFTEIANPEEQLALWKLVADKMWAAFGQQAQQHPTPVSTQQPATSATKVTAKHKSIAPTRHLGKRNGASAKAHKPKRLPITPAPKPLPKPNPQQLTPIQASKQQTQQHQQLAKHISQAILTKPVPKASPGSNPTTEPVAHPVKPMNAGYSERDKDELVFHSRSSNPLKPLEVKNR